jgi:type IV/VI secretion system ImpK/VasF family protein
MYDILLYGLKLRDRVAAGERPHPGAEQAKLKAMLGPAGEPPPWGGDTDPVHPAHGRGFLGIRYALACWLDEVLVGAGWTDWDKSKLEFALYRTNLRAKTFWDQAYLAEATPHAADAREAFLLCVLLGFRGEPPDRLREWIQATRSRVIRGLGRDLPPLPEKVPVTDVPPLLGIESYRRMTRWLVGGLLAAALVGAFLGVVLLSYS